MAVSDLQRELEKIPKINDATQQNDVCNALLTLLDDKSGDLPTAAVKCLGIFVNKVPPEKINVVVDRMGANLVDPSKSESHDISCEGLKSVCTALDEVNGKIVIPKLLSNLLKGLNSTVADTEPMKLLCMALLAHILVIFPAEGDDKLHGDLLKALTALLETSHPSVPKTACTTLGPLTSILNTELFRGLMDTVMTQLGQSDNKAVYIQLVGVVSKASGNRLAEFLPKLVPTLFEFARSTSDDEEGNIELYSNCLYAFESLIRRCPGHIAPFISDIVDISTGLVEYDPNLAEMDTGMDGEAEDVDWGDDGDGDDVGWGDDDDGGDDVAMAATAGEDAGWGEYVESGGDETWKVRLAAGGVLSAFIAVRGDMIKPHFDSLVTRFVGRFGDRDSSVQEEVLNAASLMVQQAVVPQASNQRRGSLTGFEEDDVPTRPTLVRQTSVHNLLSAKIDVILKSAAAQFSKGTLAVQTAIFSLLKELVTVMLAESGGQMPADYLDHFTPHLVYGVEATGKASCLNHDALAVMTLIFEKHTFGEVEQYVQPLANAAMKSVATAATMSKPDALLACGAIAKAVEGKKMDTLAADLYLTVFAQLKQKDTPEQIKNASIHAMASVLASHGKQLQSETTKNCLPVLMERMSNEVSREPVLKGLTRMANSNVQMDLSSILTPHTIVELSSFLRKIPTSLRHSTVMCLEALVRTHGQHIKDYTPILDETPTHISDSDLLLSAGILRLVSACLVAQPNTAGQVGKTIASRALIFARSQLLHGSALRALIGMFQSCVTHGSKSKNLTFSALFSALQGLVGSDLSKVGLTAVSQCIAGIVRKASPKEQKTAISKFIADCKGSHPDFNQIALLSLGEIGRHVDLASYKGLDGVIFQNFSNADEQVRLAAAFAFGSIAVGSLDTFLPLLLAEVAKGKQEYLLLCALKECIVCHRGRPDKFAAHVDKLLPILDKNSDSEDEGTRIMVAECLGNLTIIASAKLIPKLSALVQHTSPRSRQVGIAAVRHSFSSRLDWNLLRPQLPTFLKCLNDETLAVKQEAVVCVSALSRVHVQSLDRDLMSSVVLPALYRETKPVPELVKVVDYGNFKDVVDSHVILRQGAFTALGTILDVAPMYINLQELIEKLKLGVADETGPEVSATSFRLMCRLAKKYPSAILEELNSMFDMKGPLIKYATKHMKLMIKNDQKSLAVCRGLMEMCAEFDQMSGVSHCAKYVRFQKVVKKTKPLNALRMEIAGEK